jgi:hypothetical protein
VPELAELPDPPATPPAFEDQLAGVPRRVRIGQLLRLLFPQGTTAFRAVLYSTPTVLAEGGAATSTEVAIPAGTTPGTHTLVVWTLVDGQVRVAGQELVVLEDDGASNPTTTAVPGVDPGELPRTGSSAWDQVRLAIQLQVAGLLLLLIVRGRRRRLSEGATS